MIHLLQAGSLVIAEEASENDFGNSIVDVPRNEIASVVKRYLSDGKLREKQLAQSRKWLADHSLGKLLQSWIEQQSSLDIALKSTTLTPAAATSTTDLIDKPAMVPSEKERVMA